MPYTKVINWGQADTSVYSAGAGPTLSALTRR